MGPSLLFRFHVHVSSTEDKNMGGLGTRLAIHHVANKYCWESLVSFLHKYDVIKIGPKQKSNVLCVVQSTMLQRSVCMIFDAR